MTNFTQKKISTFFIFEIRKLKHPRNTLQKEKWPLEEKRLTGKIVSSKKRVKPPRILVINILPLFLVDR